MIFLFYRLFYIVCCLWCQHYALAWYSTYCAIMFYHLIVQASCAHLSYLWCHTLLKVAYSMCCFAHSQFHKTLIWAVNWTKQEGWSRGRSQGGNRKLRGRESLFQPQKKKIGYSNIRLIHGSLCVNWSFSPLPVCFYTLPCLDFPCHLFISLCKNSRTA